MSQQKIQVFNKMLLDTVSFLMKKFPDDKDISYTQYQIELANNTTPRITFDSVMEYIPLYETQITNQDEAFFINLANQEESLRCFNLHDKWNTLGDQEKEYLFIQFRKMLKLGQIIQAE